MGSIDVSFVTPVFDCEDTLARALEGILSQRTSRPFEVVIVDDGSRDGSLEVARSFERRSPERVRVFTKANGGEASALNVGFRQATGKFLAIVEGDVELAPDWLETCASVLEREPDVIAAGGYLETPREDPWIARLAGYEVERKFATKPREAKHLTSANVLYRREAWDLAGPFDERLVNASLDSVFNGRLVSQGKRLVYEPRARVRHHYKTTFAAYLRRQFAYARYRVHNEVLDLYPEDRWLALHVAIAGIALALLFVGPLAFALTPDPTLRLAGLVVGPALLLLALALELPAAASVWKRTGDSVALAYPIVLVFRNVVGAFGYALGLFMKAIGRA
jgi:glycosyltransferase involved in cell wall biosynthesis